MIQAVWGRAEMAVVISMVYWLSKTQPCGSCVAMNAHGCMTVACGVCLCQCVCVRAGAPCGVQMYREGVMVRVWLLCLHPHCCSHLALISGSLGREPRFRIQENVPGSGHCAEPCSGSPSGNCPGGRRRGSVEIGLRMEEGGSWLPFG